MALLANRRRTHVVYSIEFRLVSTTRRVAKCIMGWSSFPSCTLISLPVLPSEEEDTNDYCDNTHWYTKT